MRKNGQRRVYGPSSVFLHYVCFPVGRVCLPRSCPWPSLFLVSLCVDTNLDFAHSPLLRNLQRCHAIGNPGKPEGNNIPKAMLHVYPDNVTQTRSAPNCVTTLHILYFGSLKKTTGYADHDKVAPLGHVVSLGLSGSSCVSRGFIITETSLVA